MKSIDLSSFLLFFCPQCLKCVLTNNEYYCINNSNNCEIERHGHLSVVRLNHNLKHTEICVTEP